MGVFLSILFGFVPMFLYAAFLYWMDRYEKEPKRLLRNIFIWGAVVSAGGAFFINTVLGLGIYAATGSASATELATSTLIAPIVEEGLKGFAVILVFLYYRSEFDSIVDGIIYASVAALGFAATENSYYIYNYGFAQNGYSGLFQIALLRSVVVGWQHPFFTSFFGIGLAWARMTRNGMIKLLAPVFGLGAAITAHSLHNALASLDNGLLCSFGTLLDWSGWIIMGIFFVIMVNNERSLLVQHLAEEVQLGTITPLQYQVACSPVRSSRKRLHAWSTQNHRVVNQFFDLCGELAHKKGQYLRFGEEKGNLEAIQKLREELSGLSPNIY